MSPHTASSTPIIAQVGERSMKKSRPDFTKPIVTKHELNLRKLLALIIHDCRKSRTAIAEDMEAISGFKVTVSMLNLWTAPSRAETRFPAVLVDSFCEATADDRLRRFLLGSQLCGILEVGESVVRVSRRLAERRKKVRGINGCAT